MVQVAWQPDGDVFYAAALKAHEAAGGRVELSVAGVPNVSIGRQVLDAVRALDGVSEATTRHGGRGKQWSTIKRP